MASKADQYVTLRLLNAITNGATQAEAQELRADVLSVYGLSEDDAAELVTGDALETHSKGKAADKAADKDEDDETTTSGRQTTSGAKS